MGNRKKHRIKHILFLCCLCIAGGMGICSALSTSIHLHVICFPLWLIRGLGPNIKMRCKKWWKSNLEDERDFLGLSSLCANPETEGVEGLGFSFSFFTSFCPLPPICSTTKCCNVSQSLWQKLVHGNIWIVFVHSYAKHDLLKVVAWRGSIWIYEHHFSTRKEDLLVFTHFKVESFPINTLNIMRI